MCTCAIYYTQITLPPNFFFVVQIQFSLNKHIIYNCYNVTCILHIDMVISIKRYKNLVTYNAVIPLTIIMCNTFYVHPGRSMRNEHISGCQTKFCAIGTSARVAFFVVRDKAGYIYVRDLTPLNLDSILYQSNCTYFQLPTGSLMDII